MIDEADRPIRGRRIPRCTGCGLYVDLCLCRAWPRLSTETEVVVLLHPLELHKSTNTGKLAAQMLARGTALARDRPAAEPPPPPGTYVLFPHATAIPIEEAKARGVARLVVPDGTWPQAARRARRDPACVGAPCVSLGVVPPRLYTLRKSARPQALSTLEAIAEALRVLEGDAVADAMREAFRVWVERSERVRRGAHEQRLAERDV